MLFSIFKSHKRNQYFSVLIGKFSWHYSKNKFQIIINYYPVNLITFAHGSLYSWLSPALLILDSDDTPLQDGPLDAEKKSLLGSAIVIGGLFGILLIQKLSQYVGYRVQLIFLALPHFVSCFLQNFSSRKNIYDFKNKQNLGLVVFCCFFKSILASYSWKIFGRINFRCFV